MKDPFEYQAPTPKQLQVIATVREQFKALRDLIVLVVPPGLEQSHALTNLKQASMWAAAAVVLEEPLCYQATNIRDMAPNECQIESPDPRRPW